MKDTRAPAAGPRRWWGRVLDVVGRPCGHALARARRARDRDRDGDEDRPAAPTGLRHLSDRELFGARDHLSDELERSPDPSRIAPLMITRRHVLDEIRVRYPQLEAGRGRPPGRGTGSTRPDS